MANLPIISGSLPSGTCYSADPQDLFNAWAAVSYVQLDVTGARYVISQNTTPSATQRDFLWHNTDTSRLLFWQNSEGAWVMRHPEAAGGSARRIYVGTLASIDTYDGGAVGAVGNISGPMWERDTAFNDRFPIGVGTIATSELATGGAMSVTIAKANLPTDKLEVNTAIIGQAGVGSPEPVVGTTYGYTSVSGSGLAVDGTATSLSARYFTKGQTEAMGAGTSLSVQNSYIGVYILKRTARVYYTS